MVPDVAWEPTKNPQGERKATSYTSKIFFLHLTRNVKLHSRKTFPNVKFYILKSLCNFIFWNKCSGSLKECRKQNWMCRKQLNGQLSDSNSTLDRKWKIKGYCFLHFKNYYLHLSIMSFYIPDWQKRLQEDQDVAFGVTFLLGPLVLSYEAPTPTQIQIRGHS